MGLAVLIFFAVAPFCVIGKRVGWSQNIGLNARTS